MRTDIYKRIIQKTTAADGSLPYAAVCYFHRQAGNHLESGEVRGNMRVVLSDERRKILDLIVDFFHLTDAFRSISYAFRSLHPKITNNLPINYVTEHNKIRGDEF